MEDLAYLYVLAEAVEPQEENNTGHEGLHGEPASFQQNRQWQPNGTMQAMSGKAVLFDDRDAHAYPTFYL